MATLISPLEKKIREILTGLKGHGPDVSGILIRQLLYATAELATSQGWDFDDWKRMCIMAWAAEDVRREGEPNDD